MLATIRTRERVIKRFKRDIKHEKTDYIPSKDFINMENEIISDADLDVASEPYEKTYTYMADDILDIQPNSIKETDAAIQINFRISKCRRAVKPYIEFAVIKNNDKLAFPTISTQNGIIPDGLKDCDYYGKVIDIDDEILLYECPCVNEVTMVQSNDSLFWVTLDDAVNVKKVFSMEIDESVTELLLNNEKLMFLQDEDGILVETPMTGYKGAYYKKMAFIAALGVPRSGPYSSLGPYFYFADFDRSLRYACITYDGKPKVINGDSITIGDTPVYLKGGMVKFVLFMGHSKVMMNLKHDKIDTSDESKALAEKRPFIKTILRLRDSAGQWSSSYDSVIQPTTTVFDPELNRERQLDPQFVVKDFNQQVPISYAYFDTTNITINPKTSFYDITMAKLI